MGQEMAEADLVFLRASEAGEQACDSGVQVEFSLRVKGHGDSCGRHYFGERCQVVTGVIADLGAGWVIAIVPKKDLDQSALSLGAQVKNLDLAAREQMFFDGGICK